MLAQTLAQHRLLRTAPREHQVEPRVPDARREERIGEEIRALLAGEPPRVENRALAGEQRRVSVRRVEPGEIDATLPATDPLTRDPELRQVRVGGGARGEHDLTGAIEPAQRGGGHELQVGRAGPQAGIGGQLGVVAARAAAVRDPVGPSPARAGPRAVGGRNPRGLAGRALGAPRRAGGDGRDAGAVSGPAAARGPDPAAARGPALSSRPCTSPSSPRPSSGCSAA